jgi:heme-degrading monooxygenase HmoA
MIARIWRGHTRVEDAESYTRFIEKTGLADYRATPGNLGAAILRKKGTTTAEFLVLSFWEDFDAIRKFAGPDVEKAHYYPEDERYLLGKEPRVAHYELASGVGLPGDVTGESRAAVRFAGGDDE